MDTNLRFLDDILAVWFRWYLIEDKSTSESIINHNQGLSYLLFSAGPCRLSPAKLSSKTAGVSRLLCPRKTRSPRLESRELSLPPRPLEPDRPPRARWGVPQPSAAPVRSRPPSARLGSSHDRRWMWCVGTAGIRSTCQPPDAHLRVPGAWTGPRGSSRRSCACTGAPGDTADPRCRSGNKPRTRVPLRTCRFLMLAFRP